MSKARLEEKYYSTLRPQLQKELGLENIMEVPRISKVVINTGVKEAVGDSKILGTVQTTLAEIVGQAPVRTKAHKSIAGFKIREGMPLGLKVTLRRCRMYEFLDRLINLTLPRMKDFHGVTRKLDGSGNYNLGIRDWMVFPEVDYNKVDQVRGMNITIETTTTKDEHAFKLLESFGMPYKKQ